MERVNPSQFLSFDGRWAREVHVMARQGSYVTLLWRWQLCNTISACFCPLTNDIDVSPDFFTYLHISNFLIFFIP